MQGKFIIIDGMDGSGKSVVVDAMMQEAQAQNMKLLDLHQYWQEHASHPKIDDLDVDIIISSEPTYILVGELIRNEFIKTTKHYSAMAIAQAYALDRQILYDQVIIPARKKGIHIIQSRSVSTSLIYQPLDAKRKHENLTLDDIKSLPGNKQALEHNPTVLVLLELDANEAISRLHSRTKKDDASFEELDFQQQVRQAFLNDQFKSLYEQNGTVVLYPDVCVSIQHTALQAKEIFKKFILLPQ